MSALSEVPSVVKVLDWFEENETAYLVMEHVRGMGLDRYLERLDEPLSVSGGLEADAPGIGWTGKST